MTTAKPTFELHLNPTPAAAAARTAALTDPGFGRVFTDHMVTIGYSHGAGWHAPEIRAREPIALDPAAAVLHYAQAIFEGLKAYRTPGGGVALFRPEANARRFAHSAARLAMPPLPEAWFVAALEELVRIDRHWIPAGDGSLYLRPFMIATEAFLGVRPATEYRFLVIASPVGAYFHGGRRAITVWVPDQYTRAAPGGTGAAKCAGNYAASLLAQSEAAAQGCDQVVFLDAVEHHWVEELGGMNLFFVFDDGSILTPPLAGTILPGITRECLLELAARDGLVVREAPYSIDAWRADAGSGRLREVFACGTAAVVTSIGSVRSAMGGFTIGDGSEGPVGVRLRDQLLAIQHGTAPDPFGWVDRLW